MNKMCILLRGGALVLTMTVVLLFASCPIQFQPYLEIELAGDPIDVGNYTGQKRGRADSTSTMIYASFIEVILHFDAGRVTDIDVVHNESFEYVGDVGSGGRMDSWIGLVIASQSIPAHREINTHGFVDIFSGATLTFNGLGAAARIALAP